MLGYEASDNIVITCFNSLSLEVNEQTIILLRHVVILQEIYSMLLEYLLQKPVKNIS